MISVFGRCITQGRDSECETIKAAQNKAFDLSKSACEANIASQKAQCEAAKQSIIQLNFIRAKVCQGGVFTCEIEDKLRSLVGEIGTPITFSNLLPHNIQIYWLNYKGERVRYNELAQGEQYTQRTYISHPWVVADDHGRCIEVVVPRKDATVVVVD
jgi:hypothetical protein